MTRIGQIRPEFVDFIPERLEPGVLYVSRRYSTASHLCCCGCGLEVVTPLSPAKWRLLESNGAVSLNPSVGNWSFPCRSHYWIKGNRVQWAGAMSAEQIAAVKARDRRDVEAMVPQPQGLFVRFVNAVVAKISSWFGR
ncbi:MAG: hypothetical protein ABS35_16015 [Kaistia sp. SCN 65-12]|nr:MAG: hypothetical protein ABS35_16015 [Kaistia sp. SCN 65-12]